MIPPYEPLAFVPTLPRLFPEARAALSQELFSHRSPAFDTLFRATLQQLRTLCGNDEFEVIMAAGTGTLANDMMVWNYALDFAEPLVVANGEFGARLSAQCRTCNSNTRVLNLPLGTPITADLIRAELRQHPKIDALFAVANESSCAQMVAIEELSCFHLPVYLDGVSAVGVQDAIFHTPEVLCVTASSGKALAGLPGISIIFYKERPRVSLQRPITLDMVSLIDALDNLGGVRNTFGSLQLRVFHAALNELLTRGVSAYVQHLQQMKTRIVEAFAAQNIALFAHANSPLMSAFERPKAWDKLLQTWAQGNIEVYHHPAYLQKNNLFEIATMGDFNDNHINRLLESLL